MIFTRIRSFCCIILIYCVMSVILSYQVLAADSTIYVNSAENPISDAYDSVYAIGADGNTSVLGNEPYAMTASGVQKVGEESAATLTPSPSVTPVATPEPEFEDIPVAYSTVKVGLYYGNTALTEANLENNVGNGFLFGYFDDNREFHEVARTDTRLLTVTSDLNITTEYNITLGCYHIIRHGSYATFDEAKAAADLIGGFPAYYSGSFFVVYGHYQSKAEAEAALIETGIDGIAASASSKCITISQTGTDKIIFEFDSTYALAIRPICESEKAITWFNQLRYYGDFQFSRLTNNQYLTAVNYVDIEDYVKGVIPYEMYVTWPMEALKAQALCARNYVATNFNRYRSHGFDVTADIYSQVYKGIGDATETTNAAVDATAGQYIRYQGAICQTFFFSSDGGATESSENVWGGNPIPYLVGVVDPYEDDVETYSKNWTYTLSATQIQELVNARMLTNLGEIEDIACVYTDMGNIKSLTFIDKDGRSCTVSGNRCIAVMNAKSQRFTVEKNENGDFAVTGSGWGHNCGMSQYGAYSMAKHHGKTAEEIIKFYYTGVYIR